MVFRCQRPPQFLGRGFILNRQPSLRPTNGQPSGLLRSARFKPARQWSKPSPSSHLPGFPSLPRDIRPKCPLAPGCPFAITGVPPPAQFRPRRFDVLDGLLHFNPWSTLSSRPPRPRFYLQGLVTHTKRNRLVTCLCPLVVGARCLSVLPLTPTSSAPPSGLCSVRESVVQSRGFSP